MSQKNLFIVLLTVFITASSALIYWFPTNLRLINGKLEQQVGINPPVTVHAVETEGNLESPCTNEHPQWREAQVIEGVKIDASKACEADNPYEVATFVKGTNGVSMATLMQTDLAQDALIMGDDLDHDGDPDVITLKLEIAELNGSSPDGSYLMNTFGIAPGIEPALWVYTPKARGMGVKNFNSKMVNPLLRAPSPVIRVEQGDRVTIVLENTHYLPHTIHLHGVDHPWMNSQGDDNDGTEEHAVFPGQSHQYQITPRHAGTMMYHCHVQTAQHLMMGLSGLFIIEENRPDNWLQTFNVGAGQLRHRSVSSTQHYQQEYDLHYQSIDKRLMHTVQDFNDPRLIAQEMNRRYNMNESFENYFLLNGRSFPYTLRDSMIITQPNENIKLHVLNSQRSAIALHFHGHKLRTLAYDGVDLDTHQQISRDVLDIAPAQRVDVLLSTQNDGLHSYGEGLWMFHDHVPTGTTSDGIEPGGNMAILAYQALLDDKGMPMHHDTLFNDVFSKDYYTKQRPTWQEGDFATLLGDAGTLEPHYAYWIGIALLLGIVIGLLAVIYQLRKGHQQ